MVSDPLAKLRDRRVKTLIANLPPERSCDDCDLCCTAVGVREIDKAAAEPCKHLCGEPGQSCGIYDRRPRTCREFYCMWRVLRDVPVEFAPKDCGFVVAVNDVHVHPMIVTVHPDPARPDAWDTLRARKLFLAIAEQWNALVVIGQGKLAQVIFAPQGCVFTKEEAPELFINGGEQIGAPDFLFRPSDKPVHHQRQTSSKLPGTQWSFK